LTGSASFIMEGSRDRFCLWVIERFSFANFALIVSDVFGLGQCAEIYLLDCCQIKILVTISTPIVVTSICLLVCYIRLISYYGTIAYAADSAYGETHIAKVF
jgi:hypothetical protein